MVKVKNKRNSGLADKVHNKRKGDVIKKKLNPFEVHINKEKLKVLGQKTKHDRGLPGVSRAKAMRKRKETLGTEMKLMNKTNAFIDRRIGERDTQLSAEDRMIARFAAERSKQHSKKNIYNLADDEILTHRGQTLEQIEKFDDPKSSDDEDDEGKKGFGGLDNEFVSEGHFGGGFLSKTDSKDGAKSHKDLIEQLIAESKKRKAEKQKEKEQTLDLTEKLDSEWKDLQPVVFKRSKVEEKKESVIDKLLSQAEKQALDYDKMMRELRFEKRGTPSDGLKSDEKQAKEERERLQLLEKERERRMLGEEEAEKNTKKDAPKHRSADDLDGNYELEDESNFMLAYDKDGKPLMSEKIEKENPVKKKKIADGYGDSEDSDDENEENKSTEDSSEDFDEDGSEKEEEATEKEESEREESGESEDDIVEKLRKIRDKENNDSKVKQNGEVKENGHKKEQTDDSDAESKDDDDSKNENKEVEKNNVLTIGDKDDDSEGGSDDESDSGDDEDQNDDFNDLKGSEEESDGEKDLEEDADVGSFFDLKSEEGDKLKDLLTGKTPSQQYTALQKLIKSYDPGLNENNKDLLSRLFAHMLQYVNDIFSNPKDEGEILKSFLIFDKIVPHFYDLAHTNKVSSKKFIAELLKEKYASYKKHPKVIPELNTLIFFKLISILYPTSDFRHPVTTPSLIFMSEILTTSRFNNAFSISRGLFVASLVLEYTCLSKRYVPSVVNFLRGILYLASNTGLLNPIQLVPPFKLNRDAKILNLEDDCSKMAVGHKMAAKDLVLDEIDEDFKIRCLFISVQMLKELFNNFNELESQEFLFSTHLKLLGRVELDFYPKKVSKFVADTMQKMKESLEVKTYTPMCREKKKPKMLRLYEPDVLEVFTSSKSSKMTREQTERARLQSKYKKEMKGALREIRRDKSYIASVKIKQKIHSDNIRKDKVKQIYKDASIQQSELNKLKRMK